MWLAKDLVLSQTENRSMKNALKAIELKILMILEKLCSYRLNLQVFKFLKMFRKFQEINLDPHIASEPSLTL